MRERTDGCSRKLGHRPAEDSIHGITLKCWLRPSFRLGTWSPEAADAIGRHPCLWIPYTPGTSSKETTAHAQR
jgi:hypothetical protein